MNKRILLFTLLISNLILISSCKKDPEIPSEKTPSGNTDKAPDSYNFENVNYSGQTVRILLLDSLKSILKDAHKTAVSEQTLINIFENNQNLFTTIAANKRLSDKCEANAKTQLYYWFRRAGVLSGSQPMNSYLVDTNGMDIQQMVEKTIMGSVFYYQAADTYLANVSTKDNTNVTAGEGTAMAHSWDEAFGYYGAPVDFKIYSENEQNAKGKDSNADGKIEKKETPLFHAGYSLTRDAGAKGFPENERFNFRLKLMTAFLEVRFAIINKDNTARDKAKTEVLTLWERQIAASAVHYCNSAKAKMVDPNGLNKFQHEWSECKAFINCLKYNSSKKITDADLDQINIWIGSSPSEATAAGFDNAKNKLKSIYGFTDYQASNL